MLLTGRFTFGPRALAVALLVLWALALPGCARTTRFQSLSKINDVATIQLSNGLTVYALESHSVPLVTLDMWVRVGSKDEPSDIAGISHFLEHMMFKGTPRLGVGEYDRRIEELGGYLNAATSTDYTHYYMTVPSEHLESALEDMVDVMLNSLFDPTEVSRERSVILEEIRQKQDNPIGFLYDEVTRAVYASGPYANTVIGNEESVGAMTRHQLVEHYQRFYAPENMVFVIVGDFRTEELKALLERHFTSFERVLQPWHEDIPATEFHGPQERVWERDWRQTYFFVTFPGVDADSIERVAAIDVAESILLGGRSSRLVNSLREKKRLVTSIAGFFQTTRHPGFLAIYGMTSPEKMEQAREALFEELDRLRREGPSGEEMRRAKRQLVNEHLYHAETNTGKASLLGYSFALFGDDRLLHEYPRAVEKVSNRDVREVLEMLVRERASMFVARPAAISAAR